MNTKNASSNGLVVLSQKTEAIKPKLLRTEIVAIMAHRILTKRIKDCQASRAKLDFRRETIDRKIIAVQKAMAKIKPDVEIDRRGETWPHGYDKPRVKGHSQSIQVTYTYNVLPHIPAHLHTEIDRWLDDEQKHDELFSSVRYIGADGKYNETSHLFINAKAEARALLASGQPARKNRVPELLADPELQKAFDAAIEKLENAPSDKKALNV